jgi:hypothetical protein
MKTKKTNKTASRPARGKAAVEEDEPHEFDPEKYRVSEPEPGPGLSFVEVQCPFCDDSFEVRVDASQDGQSLVQECPLCCKTVRLSIDVDDGEVSVFADRAC